VKNLNNFFGGHGHFGLILAAPLVVMPTYTVVTKRVLENNPNP